jgi:hypothetical protein
MASFVTTDAEGNFVLDGRPHFVHGATYFGRRPGTCGADWMGEHFEHNATFLERDFGAMAELGLNMVGLFVPAREFFRGLEPVPERFERLDLVLDAMGKCGLRAIVYASRAVSREAWCEEHGVEGGEELWHPAVSADAEAHRIASDTAFRSRYAGRPEILGWATTVGRFFRYGFDVPPVRQAWARWLEERFQGNMARARELLDLAPDERSWAEVRMPTEMEPYLNEDNPRSFEFALMQQVQCARCEARVIEALRAVTPDHLMVHAMEGCCFSSGHLTDLVPEMIAADALWLECYNWEGLRAYHFGDGPPRWMKEPVADKPSADIIANAGYVQMLVRWARRSGKPVIICHGVDIGERKRGTLTEEDQELLIGRFNTCAVASGAHGVNYWCWSDDELSKTYTRAFGIEYTVDTPEAGKDYLQAGETMGLLRFDGSRRPACDRVRALSDRMAGRPAAKPPGEVLVLFPAPTFQSLHRYRSNLTGFALFTSLARQGILADAAMTSAGEELIAADALAPYRLVILGAPEYTRDHAEVPPLLLHYVRGGGALFLPLAEADRLQDPYGKWREAPALAELAGAAGPAGREPCARVGPLHAEHPSFALELPASWELQTDEEACLTRLAPADGAEVLVRSGAEVLLYRRRVGCGAVYAFTWSLDALLFRGREVDYPGGDWDWLWQGIAQELGLKRNRDNPVAEVVREMMR